MGFTRAGGPRTTDLSTNSDNHGKSQEEAPSEDGEAQTPQAPEDESSQEAHLVALCRAAGVVAQRRPFVFPGGVISRVSVLKTLSKVGGADEVLL
jgi:hypothetical protein